MRNRLFLALTLLSPVTLNAQSAKRVDYEISFPNRAQHEWRVTAT